MTLRQMAEATGGQAFFPSAMKDVESAYDKVLAEIKGQYHLGYRVDQHARRTARGARSRFAVKRPDVRIRARKGYFGPYQAPAREPAPYASRSRDGV